MIVFLMILMGLAFFVIATLRIQQMLLMKYFRAPPGIVCSKQVEVYGDSLVQMAAAEMWQLNVLDNDHFALGGTLNERVSRQGALACFCQH